MNTTQTTKQAQRIATLEAERDNYSESVKELTHALQDMLKDKQALEADLEHCNHEFGLMAESRDEFIRQRNEEQSKNKALEAEVHKLREALKWMHDSGVDAFNFISGARPPITRELLISDLQNRCAEARAALNSNAGEKDKP